MNQQNSETDEAKNDAADSSKVNIQPSEPEGDAPDADEKNNPGRTPGKAEGALETVEEDLDEKKR